LIAIIETASNASSVFDKKDVTPCKPELRTKTHYWSIHSLAQNKRPPIKKDQNTRGSKQKTSDEKRGNPKMQCAQNKRVLMKKEATSKYKGLKIKDLR
jgi:hypothetical protein